MHHKLFTQATSDIGRRAFLYSRRSLGVLFCIQAAAVQESCVSTSSLLLNGKAEVYARQAK